MTTYGEKQLIFQLISNSPGFLIRNMWNIFRYRSRFRYEQIILAIAVTLSSVACSNTSKFAYRPTDELEKDKTELNIWWEQGYNLEEDEAIRKAVNNWQEQTGNKVKLSFFTNDELIGKAERAVRVGNNPDIMMNLKGEKTLYPRLAWEDKLEDVSDILEPIQASYPENILRGVTYYNAREDQRSYYGIPIYQSTLLIFYWQQLLSSVGLNSQDIPQDWAGFWQFWQQAQTQLNNEQNRDIYGLGFSLSGDNAANDTYHLFEQILEAHDINLFNDQGQLNIDQPEIRRGIIDCLNWYSKLYRQSYIPPDAVEWTNVDNNRNLLNQYVLMTPNATLSIPATVIRDQDTYYNQLGITEFPQKPNGESMRYFVFIGQAIIFKNSPHKSIAKDFLRYFIQPQVTTDYLKASNSRNQPVQNAVWADSYWQNSQDPYISTASKILRSQQTRLSYVVEHPAYSQVLAENVWGKALTQVTINQVNSEQAANQAIARIKEIFGNWEK